METNENLGDLLIESLKEAVAIKQMLQAVNLRDCAVCGTPGVPDDDGAPLCGPCLVNFHS